MRGASTRQWSRVPVSSFTASDSESYLGNLPCVQVEEELFFSQILCFILCLDSRDPFSICSFYCVRHEPLFFPRRSPDVPAPFIKKFSFDLRCCIYFILNIHTYAALILDSLSYSIGLFVFSCLVLIIETF